MEVQVLRGFGRESQLRRKWDKLWTEVGERILRLPCREQNILLEDLYTANKSRLMVMEEIGNENRDH